jgi:hypothetical protein
MDRQGDLGAISQRQSSMTVKMNALPVSPVDPVYGCVICITTFYRPMESELCHIYLPFYLMMRLTK